MSDHRAIDELLGERAKNQEPLIDDDGVDIDTAYIMARIQDIGEKITHVSHIFRILSRLTRFFPTLSKMNVFILIYN